MNVLSSQELEVSSIITDELRTMSGGKNNITAATLASCIKTVAALEFQVTIAQLPHTIWALYDEASTQSNRIYGFDEAVRRLKGE